MEKDMEKIENGTDATATIRGCGYGIGDEKQLRKLGAQWADRLGLGTGSGWTIFYRIVDVDDVERECECEGSGAKLGYNDCDWESKTSVITIYRRKAKEDDDDAPMYVFEEETLIHELLHCKFPITYKEDSYGEVVLASLQHQVLNDTARALFLTKYGLTMRDYNILCRR